MQDSGADEKRSASLAQRRFWRSVVTAVVLPLAALALQWLLWPWLRPLTWFMFYPAVFFSARGGGRLSGLLTTLISIALVQLVFLPLQDPGQSGVKAVLSVALFALMGYLFSDAEGRLRRTRSALEAIIESSDDAIIGCTPAGVITSWNGGAEKLFGYTRAEALGRPLLMLSPPNRAAREQSTIERALFGESIVFETVRIRKDGAHVEVSISISPVRNADGRIVGVSKIVRDITVRKLAERRVRLFSVNLEQRVAERTAELAAANAELDAFSYAVAHDLRAPLRAISGFVQILNEDYAASFDGEARGYLDRISQAASRMSDLIDGLLTLSRSTRGLLRRDQVDLSTMAERICEELQRAEPQRSVTWAIEGGVEAFGDQRLLEVILGNLLGNAWKYSARQPEAQIRFWMETDGHARWFCVSDNGAGFDMRHARQLFKPFQRLHRQEEFGGLGIGLATVDRIVRRHGGEIRAIAVADVGATFRFTLPEQVVEPQSLEPPLEPPHLNHT